MIKRHLSVGQQTWALLCKNFLKKWRMKRETLLEWFFSFLLVLLAYRLSSNLHQVNDFPQLPAMNLGRVDNFNDSNYVIAFAPESKTTQEIMEKVASAPFMKGRRIMGWPDEKSMDDLDLNYSIDAVKVIFNDTFSYHLKFVWRGRIPKMKEHRDHSAHCQVMDEKITCEGSMFWEKGFVAFQAAINAAIIEITTNHSVMEELMSITGINMKILPFVAQAGVATDFFIFFCIISFSTFIYYLSVNVTQERQYIKSLMIMMGLRESSFWLSWGLMYAGFIFIVATLMALITKSAQVVVLTGFMVVFTLFLLYGLSLITLAFLMSVLIKKPFLTGLVVFLLTVFWGSLGFTALYRHLPAFLEWTLCLLSPFAFTAGMAQLIHLDYDVNSNIHLDSSDNPYLIIATLFMLVFDGLLYLALTLYFDKILPTEYGHRRSPRFFLNSSSWFQHQRADHVALENEIDSNSSSNDSFEPVSPEFHGREAIRIRNLKKEYRKGKHEKVEALKGLVFDIYEGQITALLGHSGAGKTTLLNMLSGLSVPTSGSVTIYNHTLSEMADLEGISKLTGVCPQSNVQFGFLTVKENLRLFAKIKGIQPHEVEQEIQQVLRDLEMENIQDILAQNLSGGQKRKLTFGIAILGDPQVLLLDEPTAGSDPLSRHRVWNLLKERKSNRVILFSTQFMDEADILADRKVFISKGRLKCAGSSLFLKKKWGIGYHLSLHLNEMCDPDSITSLVKQHIPDAKLRAQSEEKLVYILPLERTNKFPDLYRDLDRCSNQGIENYGVSMTTLNEVFLKLEGKSAIDESELRSNRRKDTGSLVELEQVLSSFKETKKSMRGMALWRQQLSAVAKVRFLKLKNEKKTLLTILLLLGISFCPQLLEHLFYELYQKSYSWGLAPDMYFLSPGQLPQAPLTHLLVINKTGSSIDNFIHSLRQQNIALEVDAFGTRSGPNEPSYNGAITVSGDDKDHRFSIACNTKRLNCFPVLMDIISNGLLGILNSSERIQTDRSTYFEEHMSYEHGYLSNSFFWIPVAACFTPYIAMSSVGDYKIQQVLRDLEMENIQDILAQNLSGGQKRKLTFGIAILGDPQVLLLDEPTAGSDPLSRHRVWNLLKERKSNRVILFSTQFMDEADILADLYRDLDRCSNQGIENYGVSMTTLNEVFLKLEGKSAIDESDAGIWGELRSNRRKDTGSLVELEQVLSSFKETKKSMRGMALWRQQLSAVAKVRFLKLKNEKKTLLTILLLLGISFCPQLLEHLFYELYQKSYSWGLAPDMYFLSPGQLPQAPLTHLLVINKTGSSIDNFIHSLRQQNIALEVDAFGTRSGPNEPSYNGAITVSGDDKDHRFSIACNTKRLNCFPVLMDIISNGLLGILNSSERIQTDRSTYFEEHMSYEHGYLSNSFFWIPVAACFTPYIAMSSVGDYKRKAYSQLRISGLYPSAYWFGQALVDIPLYFLILLLMQIMDYVFSPDEIIYIIQNLLVQILCSIGYVSSLVFLTYVISFIFRNRRKNSGIWSFFFLIITIFTIVATDINEYGFLGLFLCTILIPPFSLIGSLFIFSEISPDSVDYLGASEHQIVFLALLIPYLHFCIFVFVLRCLEVNFRKKSMRKDPVFRISPRSSGIFPNPEEPEGEDEDVQIERRRTTNARTIADFDEKPVIIASCLRKEYTGKKKDCFAKRKKKVAIRNVSFCVKKGEVIGLLGYNGAGKSTTIKMITGDTNPTAGQVILKGSSEGDSLGFLGYCPQENVLWPNLSVREHLEVFAAIKGLEKGDTTVTITRLADALKLQDQLKQPVKALSEGIKRKLCFALSILGNPSVVLLDEPSTGMDPEGQLQMWQAIRATFRNTERGALLTTHYMAEAEAVCDRVAIMVSGRLRCIGSIQHLKSKFGKDYLLELKVKNPAQVEPLHCEILRLFPQAAQQERYSSLMVYKLPVKDVCPLSQAFFKLEIVKQSFDLEEYSLSQSTLEQVFLELSKEQELDDFDEELDSSVKWKLLPQEDR
ncbi:ATP-binding cassette sub-family A member 9 [Enhydra lutris kenyoni]|uniref:ATP-binding cassette sub-family A member 9 n=1 Tax=Enhydra lutris kenyoni TaxID=391180 RepID=A0A2Y9KNL2_ENHLU|nr:ATP-binding cassette sub-family A member 9 [Enhydra lutris kenyoni]